MGERKLNFCQPPPAPARSRSSRPILFPPHSRPLARSRRATKLAPTAKAFRSFGGRKQGLPSSLARNASLARRAAALARDPVDPAEPDRR